MSLSEPFSISYAILPKADQSSSALSALIFEFEENIIKENAQKNAIFDKFLNFIHLSYPKK